MSLSLTADSRAISRRACASLAFPPHPLTAPPTPDRPTPRLRVARVQHRERLCRARIAPVAALLAARDRRSEHPRRHHRVCVDRLPRRVPHVRHWVRRWGEGGSGSGRAGGGGRNCGGPAPLGPSHFSRPPSPPPPLLPAVALFLPPPRAPATTPSWAARSSLAILCTSTSSPLSRTCRAPCLTRLRRAMR